MQAKLLRVLQEQELERLGDTRTRKVNVRIIAASNRDLKKEVDAGRFREDLFYRLSVFPIEVPPLRECRDDIPVLLGHFLEQSSRRMNRPATRITPAAPSQLTAHDWPGNVRELENTVERAVILSRGGPLHFDLTGSDATGAALAHADAAPRPALLTRNELKRQERDGIAAALKQTGGKIFGPGGAAELLGMKPTTLASRITALRLSRKTRCNEFSSRILQNSLSSHFRGEAQVHGTPLSAHRVLLGSVSPQDRSTCDLVPSIFASDPRSGRGRAGRIDSDIMLET